MPSFPSLEPTVSYFDDLDFLKDFENEFPAIVYNDALTSKSDSSTEPVEISHRIDEFDLKDETSLSKYDEEEQNVLYFNDLFPFNIIYPDDLKLDKDNDDNEIVIIQSSRVPAIFFLPCKPSISETYVSTSVKEIDYVQLGIVNQAELKLQPRAFFSFCTAAYTEVKILPNLLRT
ncbi:hypothetical protein Tco_1113068 [Tanacetum coccineum]|uniref:Uncharacterized protein n=1 Tax=Tanacetum coccineum TaxID=301880 RepID=A0ABQ5IR38_9ASTR